MVSNVDPDEMDAMSRIILIYTVCKVSDLVCRLKSLFR